MDAWDGYPAARERLLRACAAARNPVVLTGDVHRHYANDVPLHGEVVAAELVTTSVTTSVTSGGNGSPPTPPVDVQRAENPHIRWADGRPVSTAATFTLADGVRGLG